MSGVDRNGTEPNERLFVGDMSVRYNAQIVYDMFSQYGTVLDVDINQGGPTDFRPFTGYGFVKFTSKEAATAAKQALHGQRTFGRKLRIGWASRSVDVSEREETVEVFFSFRSSTIQNMVYEQTLIDLIGEITDCEVLDVAFKTYVINSATPLCFGSGFIHFPVSPQGVAAAKLLAVALRNVNVDGIHYDCRVANSVAELVTRKPELLPAVEDTGSVKSDDSIPSLTGGVSTTSPPRVLNISKSLSYASFQDMRHLVPPPAFKALQRDRNYTPVKGTPRTETSSDSNGGKTTTEDGSYAGSPRSMSTTSELASGTTRQRAASFQLSVDAWQHRVITYDAPGHVSHTAGNHGGGGYSTHHSPAHHQQQLQLQQQNTSLNQMQQHNQHQQQHFKRSMSYPLQGEIHLPQQTPPMQHPQQHHSPPHSQHKQHPYPVHVQQPYYDPTSQHQLSSLQQQQMQQFSHQLHQQHLQQHQHQQQQYYAALNQQQQQHNQMQQHVQSVQQAQQQQQHAQQQAYDQQAHAHQQQQYFDAAFQQQHQTVNRHRDAEQQHQQQWQSHAAVQPQQHLDQRFHNSSEQRHPHPQHQPYCLYEQPQTQSNQTLKYGNMRYNPQSRQHAPGGLRGGEEEKQYQKPSSSSQNSGSDTAGGSHLS